MGQPPFALGVIADGSGSLSLADWLGIAALAVAIIGIPAAYFFARRARQMPDLRASVRSSVQFDPTGSISQGLHMSFDGHTIQRVSRTIVAFWNERGDTVRGDEITRQDPLGLQLDDDDKVLQARVLYCSRDQVLLEAIPDHTVENRALISFDFLDARDGGVIEVLHQASKQPRMTGTVRGAHIKIVRLSDLSLDTLEDMRKARSRWARLWAFLDRLADNLLAIFVAFAGFVVLGSLLLRSRPGGARLVDPRKYDLRTLSGQGDFATAVDRVGKVSGAIVWVLAAATLFLAGATVFFIRRFWKRIKRVPRSIVALERADEVANQSVPSPHTEGDLAE